MSRLAIIREGRGSDRCPGEEADLYTDRCTIDDARHHRAMLPRKCDETAAVLEGEEDVAHERYMCTFLADVVV